MDIARFCFASALSAIGLTLVPAFATGQDSPAAMAATQPNLPARPKGDTRRWIYLEPVLGAARGEAVGGTKYDLGVDAEGRITTCTVSRSAGNSAVEGAICRQLTGKGYLLPATDAAGRPIAGTYRFAFPAIAASDY